MPDYGSERALAAALNTRLARLARDRGQDPADVRRAFALQQLTLRLFRAPTRDNWVLLGGTALQYRAPDEARPTKDADLASRAEFDELSTILASALEPEPGDVGTFTVTIAATDQPGMYDGRVLFELDGKRFARAKLDINCGRVMDYTPDSVTPAPILDLDALHQMVPMRIYPVEKHLADKLAAMVEVHGQQKVPSSRPHDLGDVLIIARNLGFDAQRLRAAVAAQERRRGISITMPMRLPSPLWEHSYAPRVAGSGLPARLHDVHVALAEMNEILTPALTGEQSTGRWDPAAYRWLAHDVDTDQRASPRQLIADATPPAHPRQTRKSSSHTYPAPDAPEIAPRRDYGYDA